MTYSICCHTKDFDEIHQFINHHLDLGFDKIVIYDNQSVKPVIYVHPKVKVIRWNKPIIDLNTYNDYILNHKDKLGWTAFIDEDEFINTKGLSIQKAMEKFKDYDSLALSWRIFGDKIDEGNDSNLLKKKYRYYVPEEIHSETGHNYIKSIVKNENLVKFTDPHYPILKSGKTNKDVMGRVIKGSITSVKEVSNFMWIDHYYFRGKEEYIKRQMRPIPLTGRPANTLESVTNLYNSCNILCNKKLQDND